MKEYTRRPTRLSCLPLLFSPDPQKPPLHRSAHNATPQRMAPRLVFLNPLGGRWLIPVIPPLRIPSRGDNTSSKIPSRHRPFERKYPARRHVQQPAQVVHRLSSLRKLLKMLRPPPLLMPNEQGPPPTAELRPPVQRAVGFQARLHQQTPASERLRLQEEEEEASLRSRLAAARAGRRSMLFTVFVQVGGLYAATQACLLLLFVPSACPVVIPCNPLPSFATTGVRGDFAERMPFLSCFLFFSSDVLLAGRDALVAFEGCSTRHAFTKRASRFSGKSIHLEVFNFFPLSTDDVSWRWSPLQFD